MDNNCSCGQSMELKVRSVIYRRLVEIENVPVMICDACSHSEVYPPVKTSLIRFLEELGTDPVKSCIGFEDYNEVARIIKRYGEHTLSQEYIRRLVEDRINELLDTLLLAHSLSDEVWAQDIQKKLSQLTNRDLLSSTKME